MGISLACLWSVPGISQVWNLQWVCNNSNHISMAGRYKIEEGLTVCSRYLRLNICQPFVRYVRLRGMLWTFYAFDSFDLPCNDKNRLLIVEARVHWAHRRVIFCWCIIVVCAFRVGLDNNSTTQAVLENASYFLKMKCYRCISLTA